MIRYDNCTLLITNHRPLNPLHLRKRPTPDHVLCQQCAVVRFEIERARVLVRVPVLAAKHEAALAFDATREP